jgi:hypothetical protein
VIYATRYASTGESSEGKGTISEQSIWNHIQRNSHPSRPLRKRDKSITILELALYVRSIMYPEPELPAFVIIFTVTCS